MENMDPELDLILGSKSLFELEATVNCERQCVQFWQQSVNVYVKYPVEVAAGTSQTIDLTACDQRWTGQILDTVEVSDQVGLVSWWRSSAEGVANHRSVC